MSEKNSSGDTPGYKCNGDNAKCTRNKMIPLEGTEAKMAWRKGVPASRFTLSGDGPYPDELSDIRVFCVSSGPGEHVCSECYGEWRKAHPEWETFAHYAENLGRALKRIYGDDIPGIQSV